MRGGFPRAWLARSVAEWTRWMESFTRTFLERDMPGLGSRVSPEALGRFWRMLAHFHGQVWNAAELGRSMDVSATAVNHYQDLLAGTFMIRVLPAWQESPGKRIVKSPKVYLRDSGSCISCWVWKRCGNCHCIHATAPVGRDSPWSRRSWPTASATRIFIEPDAGAELDLMLLRRGRCWGFEFKCTDVPRTTRSMHIVIEDLGVEHPVGSLPGRPGVSLNRYHHRPAPQEHPGPRTAPDDITGSGKLSYG